MPDRYEPSAFEAKWRQRWKDEDLFLTREDPNRPKFYGLDFFPYPSGAGLSVGHCRNYIPTDVICRMKYMQGHNVLHPMGFDAFGLPAENEAIKRKTHPQRMIDQYAATYQRQMELIGISYDWSRSFSSSDPRFYKWTQWVFKLLYERGLAYQKSAAVNWDPVEKTVLADEEVIGGLGWRSGVPVEKRYIPQWFFKTTAYADRLIDDLEGLNWPEGIKQQQRNWIGRSRGVEFTMKVVIPGAQDKAEPEIVSDIQLRNKKDHSPSIRVFTTRIDTVFGVTFCVIAPEHPLVQKLLEVLPAEQAEGVRQYVEASKRLSDTDRQATTREKTGVFSGAYAINPLNGERVPLWIADYVLATYGTGAIMAVPGHDARDFEFAQKFGIDVRQVIAPSEEETNIPLPYEAKDGVMVNSGEYNGLTVEEGQRMLGQWLEGHEIGERKTQYKLRDWLISRQRYWGCPIPIIYDSEGEKHAVGDDCLPVLLPDVPNYEPGDDGSSPLAGIADFVNVATPDGSLGRRETDTMGGFACSSWYFLRFCDPHDDEQAWDPEKVAYWMPVDYYVGGSEHAVMHLLYARFWTKVLYDAGLVNVAEPFASLWNQGQVLAQTPYRHAREGEHLAVGEEGIQISNEEAKALPEDQVFYRWARMSKSKGNVVTPDEAVEQYGADALRLYELFVAPFNQDVNWSNEGMQGQVRFLSKVFKLVSELQPNYEPNWRSQIMFTEPEGRSAAIRRATHVAIKKATEDIGRFAFNTYVSAMMIYVNTLTDLAKELRQPNVPEVLAFSEAIESLVLLLSPAAPHSADELWESLGQQGSTYQADWPRFDEALTQEDVVTIAVQVNGKLRDTLQIAAAASQEQMQEAALGSEKVQANIAGKQVRKVIVVPGKLVNIVAA